MHIIVEYAQSYKLFTLVISIVFLEKIVFFESKTKWKRQDKTTGT